MVLKGGAAYPPYFLHSWNPQTHLAAWYLPFSAARQLAAPLSRGPGRNLLHELKIAFHSQPPRHLTGSRRYSRERQCAKVIDRPLGSASRGSCQTWAIHLEFHKTDGFFFFLPRKDLIDVQIPKGLTVTYKCLFFVYVFLNFLWIWNNKWLEKNLVHLFFLCWWWLKYSVQGWNVFDVNNASTFN